MPAILFFLYFSLKNHKQRQAFLCFSLSAFKVWHTVFSFYARNPPPLCVTSSADDDLQQCKYRVYDQCWQCSQNDSSKGTDALSYSTFFWFNLFIHVSTGSSKHRPTIQTRERLFNLSSSLMDKTLPMTWWNLHREIAAFHPHNRY